mgnify:CR=1 FL=1
MSSLTVFFLEIAIFRKFCLEASCRVHTCGARTVNVANLTNGYAAEKGISKVVSDGEWKP